MESSESFGIDFTGAAIPEQALLGAPGDFYRDPMFRGGAIRFAAVQAGAVLRLHALFAAWLEEHGRGEDPYQLARLAEISLAAQECVLWVEKAAAVAERSFYRDDPAHSAAMIACANSMRTAIERRATQVLQQIAAGVGAHGLLQPLRFERILRDLTMYLRQPAPDQTLAAIGRASLAAVQERAGSTAREFWSGHDPMPSVEPGYFDRIYAQHDDPWNFETSDYEREKYDTTLDSLPRPRYRKTLEIGCSIGVLTERLGERSGHLLALDVSERALTRARARTAHLPSIEYACMQVPGELPADEFDLIVISEVAYYWQRADLKRAADGLAARHTPGGDLILVHLTEFVPDYPITGDEVHDYWLGRPEWEHVAHLRRPRYRLDVLRKR
jgi:SAM-dependent methyltransferase